MNFRLDLYIYMEHSIVVFLEKFSFTSSFFVKNAKKTFLKINGFGVKYFIKSKYRRIQTGLAILNQRTNGPVNVHLISWPSKAQTYQTWKISGKEMTWTFNTHIPS